MSAVHIAQLRLQLRGVAPEVAAQAFEGLEVELRRRLHLRGVQMGALRDVPLTIQLPEIAAPARLNAALLRALVTECLVALLSPEPPATDTEAL